MMFTPVFTCAYLAQVDMKAQKDELQRQRDALQRQIDLFEEHCRQWFTTTQHRPVPSRPDFIHARSSSDLAPDGRTEIGAIRTAESGVRPALRHSSPVELGVAPERRVLARVGSAGNVAAMDGRSVPRAGSLGNLTARRDSKTLPVHLMSTKNESRIGGSAGPLRSANPSSIHQLIPAKLSRPSNNPPRTSRDQRGGSADLDRLTGTRPASVSGGGHVESRDPARSAGTSVNILPMKLAESSTRFSTSSMSPRVTSQQSSPASPAATAAVSDTDHHHDDDDDDVERCTDQSRLRVKTSGDSSKVFYF